MIAISYLAAEICHHSNKGRTFSQPVNSLPNDKILNLTNLKASATDKVNVT